MIYDCIIIGGGPAGLLASLKASEKGGTVAVIERNNILGKKLRITGKGRCNITNDCDFDTLMANIPGNPKFLFTFLSCRYITPYIRSTRSHRADS